MMILTLSYGVDEWCGLLNGRGNRQHAVPEIFSPVKTVEGRVDGEHWARRTRQGDTRFPDSSARQTKDYTVLPCRPPSRRYAHLELWTRNKSWQPFLLVLKESSKKRLRDVIR